MNDKNLGELSAEAVLTQYEEAAKAVEEMGEEVKKRIKRLEAALAECREDMVHIKETAQAIRDKGKLAQAQIEEASHLSEEIRTEARKFRDRLSPPEKPAPLPKILRPDPVEKRRAEYADTGQES